MAAQNAPQALAVINVEALRASVHEGVGSGRRNSLIKEVAMKIQRRRSDRAGRTVDTMKQLYDKQQVFGFVGNVGTPTAVVALPYALD